MTMTNNPTIDGVSRELRELLERLVGKPTGKPNWDALDETRIAAAEELRALLAAPAVERQADPDCEWCGGAGHDHYGDPCTACTQVEVAALQSTVARLEARITQLESEKELMLRGADVYKERIAELTNISEDFLRLADTPSNLPLGFGADLLKRIRACLDATAALNGPVK